MFVQMNNYLKPDPVQLLNQSMKYVTNGQDNEYFYYIQDRYIGSPTNASIIDSYANYIFGEGLKFENSELNIYDYLSKSDARLISKDIKMYGAFALQVVYTRDRKNIAKLYHLSVPSVAIVKQQNLSDDIEGYWYSFDWRNKTKFSPVAYPAFGTSKEPVEIFYCKIPSPQPLFALPDYQSGLQYCKLEEELSNYYINHVKNGFMAGTLINVNQGIPENDEAKEDAERAILAKVQGSPNSNNIVISFNDNKDSATTVEKFQVEDAFKQYGALATEARVSIMMAHKVTNPILFGIKENTGFGNNAGEMAVALKTLYRSQINPIREIIIDGLEKVFHYNIPDVKINFIDFDELVIKEEPSTEVPSNNPQLNS